MSCVESHSLALEAVVVLWFSYIFCPFWRKRGEDGLERNSLWGKINAYFEAGKVGFQSKLSSLKKFSIHEKKPYHVPLWPFVGILTKSVNILIPIVPPLPIYYSFNTEWISLAIEQKYVGLQLSEIGSATVASPVSELTLVQLT